jgi:hypothetical protein
MVARPRCTNQFGERFYVHGWQSRKHKIRIRPSCVRNDRPHPFWAKQCRLARSCSRIGRMRHPALFSLATAGFVFVLSGLTTLVWSQDQDQARRLGAFAGAMQFCESRHDGDDRRFRWAQLRAFKEISELERSDRLRAMASRDRAMERGLFLGEDLNHQSCNRLLRMGEWQRFQNKN